MLSLVRIMVRSIFNMKPDRTKTHGGNMVLLILDVLSGNPKWLWKCCQIVWNGLQGQSVILDTKCACVVIHTKFSVNLVHRHGIHDVLSIWQYNLQNSSIRITQMILQVSKTDPYSKSNKIVFRYMLQQIWRFQLKPVTRYSEINK